MDHSQFRPTYLLTTDGSQQYFVSQTIPALGQVNADNVIQSQYPVASEPMPQQHSLYYYSLPPTSFTQPYSTYQPTHTPAEDSNDVQLPHDSMLSDSVMYPDMGSVPFSPPLTPQLSEQLEQQQPYLQTSAKRHSSAVPIVNPETLQEVNVADDADPNHEQSMQSLEPGDNTWMVIDDMAVALNTLKKGFETFRDQMTKDIEELRNQNREFQDRMTKDVEELRNQVTKNHKRLSVLKSFVYVTHVSQLMVSKLSEVDSYDKFCDFAREAEIPFEPEDYEKFECSKDQLTEIYSRLQRKLFSSRTDTWSP